MQNCSRSADLLYDTVLLGILFSILVWGNLFCALHPPLYLMQRGEKHGTMELQISAVEEARKIDGFH